YSQLLANKAPPRRYLNFLVSSNYKTIYPKNDQQKLLPNYALIYCERKQLPAMEKLVFYFVNDEMVRRKSSDHNRVEILTLRQIVRMVHVLHNPTVWQI